MNLEIGKETETEKEMSAEMGIETRAEMSAEMGAEMETATGRDAKKNIIGFLMIGILFVLSITGTAYAAWKVTGTSVNVINTSGVRAQILEDYDRPGAVYPGNTIKKVVQVQNTGDSACIVRVKVEKAWGTGRDASGSLITDETYSTDNILIAYNTEYWIYEESDGYYYYKGVLEAGETTKAALFEGFTVEETTGNEYMGLEADIYVKMECVQAAAEGLSVWNKSYTDLGIVYTAAEAEQTVTKVSFNGESAGFSFAPESTDLFANFKNLLPGETRSQTTEVINTTKDSVKIFLRAEDIEQSLAADGTIEQVAELLQKYVTITVTDQKGALLYSGAIWGEPYAGDSNPESMRYDISLGDFAAGETKQLNVQLQADPDMGNAYQELWGLIKWTWTAEGAKTQSTSTDSSGKTGSVKTGDLSLLVVFIILTVISGTLLIHMGIQKRKHERSVPTRTLD